MNLKLASEMEGIHENELLRKHTIRVNLDEISKQRHQEFVEVQSPNQVSMGFNEF